MTSWHCCSRDVWFWRSNKSTVLLKTLMGKMIAKWKQKASDKNFKHSNCLRASNIVQLLNQEGSSSNAIVSLSKYNEQAICSLCEMWERRDGWGVPVWPAPARQVGSEFHLFETKTTKIPGHYMSHWRPQQMCLWGLATAQSVRLQRVYSQSQGG